MALDQTTEAFLKGLAEQEGPAFHELPPEKCRELFTGLCVSLQGDVVSMDSVTNQTIDGPNGDIPIRIYNPKKTQEKLPLIVLFHGGGWVIGDLESHDNMCRYLAKASEAILVAVDYRLAPENKFPSGVDDCIAATDWVCKHGADIGGDTGKVVVTGDSAGGNMAAVVAQQLKGKIALQVLIYPVTDLTGTDYASRGKFGGGEYLLSMADMEYFGGHYSNNPEELAGPKASPITQADLSGLAPALTITAGYDPLVDEGKAYADKLKEAGVKSEYKCFEGTIHGFTLFPAALTSAQEGLDLIADYIKREL